LAGEITTEADVDYASVAREAIREIGYTDKTEPFADSTVQVELMIGTQSPHIAQGVNEDTSVDREQGAGDQGIMFGYATNETLELMPLPILLAHRLAKSLADDRKSGAVDWLRPDSKTQVSVRYEDGKPVQVTDVLVSTQHVTDSEPQVLPYVQATLVPRELGEWWHGGIEILANPTGRFELGGPAADCGVTGRKIIVDTYGGMARHGGGAFSGKDPSKVDRSGAYFCRYVARQLVLAGIADRAEIQVSYAIGKSQPISIHVETFSTGDAAAAVDFVSQYDFRPSAIVEQLDLLRPIYRKTTNYGHFGKPDLSWEA